MMQLGLVRSESTRKGVVLCLLSMMVLAAQDAITKVLVQDMAVVQFVMVRYWVFAAFAILYVHFNGGITSALRTQHGWLQPLRSIMAVAEIAIFTLALRYLGLAEAHSLFAAFPLIAIALAGPLLGEHVGLRRGLAVLAGFIGTLIILRPGMGVFKPEALIVLTAALTFALYNIVTRFVSHQDGFNTNMVYLAVIGCIAATLFGIPAWREPTMDEWVLMGVLSVTGIAGHVLLIKALHYAPASVLQPFNYSLLVFATIVGIVIFEEFPDFWTIAGASLVVASGLYAIAIDRLRRKR
ncbi:DMT family transporter [Amphritea sp. 1_MG-2023]|uniref:DMT family transporter n=1 Tax=Amphritea sp. 1_MG-2023 TaxID=3062670 RepID=UPI0026E1EF1A|nr:DMT family transporter [Amphritea sp. 1_MG-2023]MDO6564396.1 DMT family transporter [Amphritea sp. 1_MG-2023]